jgi:Helix-turn-helix domain
LDTAPLYVMSSFGNRERAIDLVRAATGLPEIAATSLVLTLDATSAAVLRTAGITMADARPVLSALWQQPARITDMTPLLRPAPTPGSAERDREFLRGLGERIHITRRARRLSEATVQAHVRIDAGLLRDIEAGAVCPSALTVLRLADVFRVPMPLLVDEKATPLRILRLLADAA